MPRLTLRLRVVIDPQERRRRRRSVAVILHVRRYSYPGALGLPTAGIGRGRYGWDAFHAVMDRIGELLRQGGAHLDGVYAAPHHPMGQGGYAHPDHPDRKPNPGMLLRAAAEHGVDLGRSWMIGDKELDLEAGRHAGCRVALVRTGYGGQVDPGLADLVADDLGAAVDQILRERNQV